MNSHISGVKYLGFGSIKDEMMPLAPELKMINLKLIDRGAHSDPKEA